MRDIKFQYYNANVYDPVPIGFVDLEDFIRANKNPSDKIKGIFNKIAECEVNGDLTLKVKLKQENLFYFTPCAVVKDVRRYESLDHFTGIICLDFDHLPDAESFKNFLFESCKSVFCCYTSPSRKGIKALLRIPKVSTIEEFKQYFFGLAFYMSKYEGFDGTGQNCLLPLFLSWDNGILTRPYEEAEVWAQKGKRIDEFDYTKSVEVEPLENITEEEKDKVISIFRRSIDKIEDNGHFQLTRSSLVLGGFVGAGYLGLEEAIDLLKECVEGSSYLSKGISGYVKSGIKFINDGMRRPLILE